MVEVSAGGVLELECSGLVDPLLADSTLYSWSRDGAEINEGWVQPSHSIKVPYLLSEHAGRYVCEIRTLLDSIRNRNFILKVLFYINA